MNLEELQNEVEKLKEYNEELKKFIYRIRMNTWLPGDTEREIRHDTGVCGFGREEFSILITRELNYDILLKDMPEKNKHTGYIYNIGEGIRGTPGPLPNKTEKERNYYKIL